MGTTVDPRPARPLTPTYVTPRADTRRTPDRASFLAAIISTAVEGGVNGWALVEGYRWHDGPDLGACPQCADGGCAFQGEKLSNARAVLVDMADGNWSVPEDDAPAYEVTVGHVAAVFGILAAGPVKGMGEHFRHDLMGASRENDAAELDAYGADALVQVALFGEVVYG